MLASGCPPGPSSPASSAPSTEGHIRCRCGTSGISLDDHLPGPAEPVEVVDVERAEINSQGVEEVAEAGHPWSCTSARLTSTKNWGTFARNVATRLVRIAVSLGRFLRAPCRPRRVGRSASCKVRSEFTSPRSSTISLNPPARPTPRTGGGPEDGDDRLGHLGLPNRLLAASAMIDSPESLCDHAACRRGRRCRTSSQSLIRWRSRAATGR